MLKKVVFLDRDGTINQDAADYIKGWPEFVFLPRSIEALRDLTRTHAKIDQTALAAFIDGLSIDDDLKAELKAITPWNYTGIISF